MRTRSSELSIHGFPKKTPQLTANPLPKGTNPFDRCYADNGFSILNIDERQERPSSTDACFP